MNKQEILEIFKQESTRFKLFRKPLEELTPLEVLVIRTLVKHSFRDFVYYIFYQNTVFYKIPYFKIILVIYSICQENQKNLRN